MISEFELHLSIVFTIALFVGDCGFVFGPDFWLEIEEFRERDRAQTNLMTIQETL
jgi:hypothetical protein